MADAILALHAGSSSIKFALFEVRDGSGLGPMSRGANREPHLMGAAFWLAPVGCPGPWHDVR